MTGVIARVTAGSQAGDWLRVVIRTGPYATVFVPVASATSSRTEWTPSGSDAVSSAIDADAVSRHGTALGERLAAAPPLSSTTWVTAAAPSTSSVARYTPPPRSVAENATLRTPATARSVSSRSPDGVPTSVGSSRSDSSASSRCSTTRTPLPAAHEPGLQST